MVGFAQAKTVLGDVWAPPVLPLEYEEFLAEVDGWGLGLDR